MPSYTSNLGLYKPDRNDALAMDTTLANNFSEIDTKLGSALNFDGKTYPDLKTLLQEKNKEVLDATKGSAFYHNIEVSYKRDSQSSTDYIVTKISHKDEEGKIIKLKRGFANDGKPMPSAESVRDFAVRNNATVAINASTFNTVTYELRGTNIHKGSVIHQGVDVSRWILGIKADNTMISFPPNTPASTMIDAGCQETLIGFVPIIEDGKRVDDSLLNVSSNMPERHPRQLIGQMANKDIVILTSDGRSENSLGLTAEDMIRLMLAEGVQFAYVLDGGGSTQTVVRGTLLSRPIDEDGYGERIVPDFLYIAKDVQKERDRDLRDVSKDIGSVKMDAEHLKRDMQKMGNLPFQIGINSWANDRPTDLNNITDMGFYWGHSTITANVPEGGLSWGILHFAYGTDGDALQVAFPFHDSRGDIMIRRTVTGGWSAWRKGILP